MLVSLAAIAGCDRELPTEVEAEIDAAPAQWATFTSDDGRFSAEFPAAPEETTQSVDSPIGSLTITMHTYESGNTAYMISHLTYPVDPSQYDVDAGLAGAVQGAASNVSGTVVESNDIEQSGFPGKEALIQGQDGMHARVRMYIDPNGPTLFQGLAVGPKTVVNGADAKKFLDSITVK